MAWSDTLGCVLGMVATGGVLMACTGGEAGPSDAATGGDVGRPSDAAMIDVASGSNDSGAAGDAGSQAIGDCGPPDGALAGYATAASGYISGADVGASVCNASAWLFQSRYSSPPGDYVLFLNSTQQSSVTATKRPDTSDWLLNGMMQVSAPAAGNYPSAGQCGFLSFEFALPVAPGVTCSGTGPNCPPGCAAACSGLGCGPCTPQQPTVGYSANGSSDCLGTAQSPQGSWTVTLTSVQPYYDDAGSNQNGQHYITHGTVTGTLPNEDGGGDMATVTLGF